MVHRLRLGPPLPLILGRLVAMDKGDKDGHTLLVCEVLIVEEVQQQALLVRDAVAKERNGRSGVSNLVSHPR